MDQTTENKFPLEKLNQYYRESEEIDKDIFAEMRSNILLVSGDHYTKGKSKFFDRIKDSKDATENQKLRVTRNHTQKIVKTYVNNILSQSPGVKCVPANEKELQDQKTAELNDSVRYHIQKKHKVDRLVGSFASDFIDIGECAVKIFWDENKGEFLGMHQAIDEETGQPAVDEMGQPVAGDKAAFSGDIVLERVYGFNLLRAKSAKTMDESPYLIYRKMVDKEDMKKILAGDDKKLKLLESAKDETFRIFDAQKGEYKDTKDQVMLREFYWKACINYPMGYFVISTEFGILFEGELPGGIFPIIYEGFDELKTTPRHRSIIKQIRPYQAEINREASQQAMNSIVHGDDKIYLLNGAKISTGQILPGLRAFNVNGMSPEIKPGRSGEQFINTISANISEMYSVANVVEDTEEVPQGADAFNYLFRSIKNKKKFIVYTKKFESFLVRTWEVTLQVYKLYCDENHLIPMIGKREMVNIAEFKNSDPLSTRVIVEPMADDMDSLMGKQLAFNHVLQYVGGNLDKKDIGKILKEMPFSNGAEAFDDFTLDYDMAKNDMLAMERGEQPLISKYDEHKYLIQRAVNRMKQADYRGLNPQIQQIYQMYVQQHEQMEAQAQQAIIDAKNQYIPIGGFLVTLQLKRSDPKDPNKQVQVRLPYQTIEWVIERLDQQGVQLDQLEEMNQGALSEMSGMITSGAQAQNNAPQNGGQSMPPAQANSPLQSM